MSPLLLAALISQVGIPELTRWLAQLHADGKVVSEAEALAKLNLDVEAGNAAGRAFLAQTRPPQP